MINENECELKLLLTKQEYNILLSKFNKNKINEIVQTNYYFDTNELLFHSKNTTLRLRKLGEKYQFTIKEKKFVNQDLHFRKSIEKTFDITFSMVKQILDYHENIFMTIPELKESINDFYLSKSEMLKVILLGSLQTYRHCYKYCQCKLYLDENTYLNNKDWELEFETNSQDLMKYLSKDLSLLNISLNKDMQGKYSRFLSEYILKS